MCVQARRRGVALTPHRHDAAPGAPVASLFTASIRSLLAAARAQTTHAHARTSALPQAASRHRREARPLTDC
eukprot:6205725-Pleurochrysis_carterae.AAC.4